MARREDQDPYAPPPMHHDRSGPVLRLAILGLLLGGAVWGYTIFASQPTTPLVAEEAPQEQLMADAGYAVSPSTLPEATSESLPQAAPAANAPAPQPRRAAPARVPAPEPAAEEPAPAPVTNTAPVTPAPIPPIDVPPVG